MKTSVIVMGMQYLLAGGLLPSYDRYNPINMTAISMPACCSTESHWNVGGFDATYKEMIRKSALILFHHVIRVLIMKSR